MQHATVKHSTLWHVLWTFYDRKWPHYSLYYERITAVNDVRKWQVAPNWVEPL